MNVKKAQIIWNFLKSIYTYQKSNPKIMKRIYFSTVITIILYFLETWTLTDRIRRTLEVFHDKFSREINRKNHQIFEVKIQWKGHWLEEGSSRKFLGAHPHKFKSIWGILGKYDHQFHIRNQRGYRWIWRLSYSNQVYYMVKLSLYVYWIDGNG